MMYTHVIGSTWTVEQPSSSLLNAHERFQQMLRSYLPWEIPATWLKAVICLLARYCKSLCASLAPSKTYKQAFWMAKFGHWMPKRSVTWSNSPYIRALDLGCFVRNKKQDDNQKSGVRQYRDKKGKRRCQGTPQLKASQCLDSLHILLSCATFFCNWGALSVYTYNSFTEAIPCKIRTQNCGDLAYVPFWHAAEATRGAQSSRR